MAARVCEHQSVVVDMPDQKPVGLDVALPRAGPSARQPMGPAVWGKGLIGEQALNDGPEFFEVLMTAAGATQVPAEPLRGAEAHEEVQSSGTDALSASRLSYSMRSLPS